MSAHVFNKLWESDKMRGLQYFIAFLQEFNIFNSTGAGMLDSIYHMPLKLLKNRNLA